MSSIADIASRFAAVAPACDTWTLRVERQRGESLSVTRGVVDPVGLGDDLGVMVTVYAEGAFGYAATSDVTASGLARAGSLSSAYAPTWAMASHIKTPGKVGRPGKCPGKNHSSPRSFHRPVALLAITSSSMTSTNKNGAR